MNRREFLELGLATGAVLTGSQAGAGAQTMDALTLPGTGDSHRWGRDLALVNAKILTLEPLENEPREAPEAEAALVRRGRIVLVGTNEDVRSRAAGAPVFDAGGQLVIPGFIDAHCHIEVACVARSFMASVHTPPLESLGQVTDALRAKAAETPAGEWVIARGSFGLERRVPEKRLLTRHDLDAVTNEHPLIVFSGRHVAMLNTRALHEMGLWEPDAVPPRGAVVHRDASGRPTGIATELYYLLPAYSTEQVKTALRAHARAMFVEKGTTSISTVPYASSDIRADLELQAEGELPLRIRMYYHVPQMISLDGLLATGFVSGVGSDMFRFGGMKLFVDGAGHNGMGQRLEDFKWSQEELDDLVARAQAAGIQVLMHVITDGAFERAATAVERAQRPGGKPHRHRLEHGGSVESVDRMRRLRDLGLLLTATPSEGRAGRTTPRYRTLLREGFEPIAITDTTGTVPGSSDPLRKIAYAVGTAGEGGGAPRGEELTFEEALRMYTLWAARGSLEEQDKGSIAPGKLGDFAVLSADPRGLPADRLFDVRVDATILGGDVVYER